MKPDFLDYIEKNVILGDGALGSYLYEQGAKLNCNLDLLNIQQPEPVLSAHEEYIRAGSQLIETNTFGANRFKLQKFAAAEQVIEINRAGARIAGQAAGHQVYVAGSIGPTGVKLPLDSGEISLAELQEAFAEQITGLTEGGIDLFIIETFSQIEEILLAIVTAKRIAPGKPIIAQMVFPNKGRTQEGIDALDCVEQLSKAGADVVGCNCGRGVDQTLSTIKRMATFSKKIPLSAFPNAGLPEIVSHRMIYPAQPDYMANRAAEMVRHGVQLIGGCCGTTPAHIHQFRKTLKIGKKLKRVSRNRANLPATHPDHGQFADKNGGFLDSLPKKEFPIIVELDPPTHLAIDTVLAGARELAKGGVNAISLGDNPLAILRSGNVALAHRIKEETGIQTIVHQTGRDLNALALQSRIMEAHILGIEAILAVTGDSASATDQPGVSGVFDLDSFGIIRALNQFNNGLNLAEHSVKKQTNFSIGAAFSFRPQNPGPQITRLEKKRELGARYAMTQPFFCRNEVEQMLDKTADIDIMIFPGIFPLISARNAEFLHNEVPGISVPAEIRKKLNSYEKIEDQRKVAHDFTENLIEEIGPMVAGLYLISPLNNWKVALQCVEQIRASSWQNR